MELILLSRRVCSPSFIQQKRTTNKDSRYRRILHSPENRIILSIPLTSTRSTESSMISEPISVTYFLLTWSAQEYRNVLWRKAQAIVSHVPSNSHTALDWLVTSSFYENSELVRIREVTNPRNTDLLDKISLLTIKTNRASLLLLYSYY